MNNKCDCGGEYESYDFPWMKCNSCQDMIPVSELMEDEDFEDDNDMEERHPGYRKENYNAGRFLGLDFPYVAGDPDF